MSGTAVVEQPSSPRALPRTTVATLVLASLVAVLFIAVAALPYFGLNEQRFGAYWSKRGWLLLHITGGMAALLAGPVQFWLGLKDQRMQRDWQRSPPPGSLRRACRTLPRASISSTSTRSG